MHFEVWQERKSERESERERARERARARERERARERARARERFLLFVSTLWDRGVNTACWEWGKPRGARARSHALCSQHRVPASEPVHRHVTRQTRLVQPARFPLSPLDPTFSRARVRRAHNLLSCGILFDLVTCCLAGFVGEMADWLPRWLCLGVVPNFKPSTINLHP